MPDGTPETWTGTVDQYAWLLQLTAGRPKNELTALQEAEPDSVLLEHIDKAARERERQARRVEALTRLRAMVKALTDRHAVLEDAQLKTLKKETKNLVAPDGKLHEAFNVWQDTATEVPSWFDALVREALTMRRYADQMLDLELVWTEARGDREVEHREPLFTDEEVEAELYTPVVRQLLYPEDHVPDAFSAVQRMIDETNKRYAEKLKDADKDTGSLDTALTLTKAGISGAAALTGGILGGVAGFDPKSAEAMKTATDIVKISEVIINGSISIGGALAKEDALSASHSAIDLLAGAVAGIMAAANPGLKTAAKYVEKGIRSAHLVPDLVSHLSTPGLSVKDRMLRIAESVESTLIDSLGFFMVEGKTPEEKANVAVFQRAAKAVVRAQTRAFTTGGTADKIVRGDTKGIVADFAELGKDLGQALVVRLAEEKKNAERADAVQRMEQFDARFQNATPEERAEMVEELKVGPADSNYAAYSAYLTRLQEKGVVGSDGSYDDGRFDPQDFGKNACDDLGDAFDSSFESAVTQSDGDLEKLTGALGLTLALPTRDPDAIDELVKSREQAQKEETDLVLASTDTFENELMGFEDLSMDRVARLTADLKRNRMVLGLMSQAGQAGFAVAATFFAPMAAAGTLVQVIELSKKAVEHMTELKSWEANADFSQSAVSPYHTAALNFIKEESALWSHNTAQAIIKGIQFAAQVAEAAGTGTPVQGIAKLVSAGTGAASTAEEIVFAAKQRHAVVQGWKITRAALDNPRDRITNLKARAMNPTLTKFTIAWGALHAKDPVALEMFNTIGLTRDVLAVDEEQADEAYDVLVGYLETRYDEHNAILIRRAEPMRWFDQLPPARIDPKSWLGAMGLAAQHTSLDPRAGRPVEVELGKLRSALAYVGKQEAPLRSLEADWKEGKPMVPKETKKLRSALTQGRDAADRLLAQLERMPRPQRDLASVYLEYSTLVELEVDRLKAIEKRVAALADPPPRDDDLDPQQMQDIAKKTLAAFQLTQQARQQA
ncbi:MAG: hypothetical protein H6736_21520 [Alphaproteobacteria bacterium]|nr:hypothetical protein [Alphaproteobacteria bacterium]